MGNKTRIEFANDGAGLQAAKDYRKDHGGRVAYHEKQVFGQWWLAKVFWYSPENTPSDIFGDHYERITMEDVNQREN